MSKIETVGTAVSEVGLSIAFVGNCISFSNDLMRLVSPDFPGLQVRRHASFAELLNSGEAALGTVVTLVLEEGLAGRLADDYAEIQLLVPNAHVALAYRDHDLAVRFLRKISHQPLPSRLSLLPMRIQYDAWKSIVSLLVSGEGYIPRDVVNSILRDLAPDQMEREAVRPPLQDGPSANLTDRELQVLELVSRGKQNKSVAAELGLSEHTVKLHMHHIISKLGARNRTEVTVWYLSRFGNQAGRSRGLSQVVRA